ERAPATSLTCTAPTGSVNVTVGEPSSRSAASGTASRQDGSSGVVSAHSGSTTYSMRSPKLPPYTSSKPSTSRATSTHSPSASAATASSLTAKALPGTPPSGPPGYWVARTLEPASATSTPSMA